MSEPNTARTSPVPPGEQPLIIQYTNLLHQYRSPEAAEVKAFLQQHHTDTVFLKRAEVLNKVFKLKAELTTTS